MRDDDLLALRRACSLSDADVLRPADFAILKLRSADRPEGGLISIDDHIRERVLRFGASWELQEIADRLGLSRKTLWEKEKKWGLS